MKPRNVNFLFLVVTLTALPAWADGLKTKVTYTAHGTLIIQGCNIFGCVPISKRSEFSGTELMEFTNSKSYYSTAGGIGGCAVFGAAGAKFGPGILKPGLAILGCLGGGLAGNMSGYEMDMSRRYDTWTIEKVLRSSYQGADLDPKEVGRALDRHFPGPFVPARDPAKSAALPEKNQWSEIRLTTEAMNASGAQAR